MNKKLFYIRLCYLLGILLAPVNAIIYLFPTFFTKNLGFPVPITPVLRCILIQSASFLLAWTFLLIWALRSPLKRRFVLILTVFPVITGMGAAAITMLLSGAIDITRAVGLAALPFILGLLFIKAYSNAGKIEKELGYLLSRN